MLSAKRLSYGSRIGNVVMVVLSLALRSASAQPPERPRMTREESEAYENRDKLAEAIAVLDNPNWHEQDPWIRYYRAEDQEAGRAAPERTQGAIDSREFSAIGLVIDADIPRERKEALLTKYLDHHNKAVVSQCLTQLVSGRYWTPERAVAYVRQNDPTAIGWYNLLGSLPLHAPMDVRAEVAREVLTASKKNPQEYDHSNGPNVEIAAARVLVKSERTSDHDLVRWSVREYPDAPLLWAAVGRLPKDEALEQLARSAYEKAGNSMPVRCAAAMVFGKDDPDVIRFVLEQVYGYLNEFASTESVEIMREMWRHPLEPKYSAKNKRLSDGQYLLAAVFELPEPILKAEAVKLSTTHSGAFGSAVLSILAKRIPQDIVGIVGQWPMVPVEAYGPLIIAADADPSLGDKVKRLIPDVEHSRLMQQAEKFGFDALAGGGSTLSLWD